VNRLLNRVWDFAAVQNKTSIDEEILDYALQRLEIDNWGLDQIDRLILKTIAEQYRGGPVGIETIAVTIGEERATLEEVYEPYLIFSGYVTRGPRGRSITKKGKNILGLSA
jgi:Holliday junction DNA helicase RuvB